jgi:hypothetical protein
MIDTRILDSNFESADPDCHDHAVHCALESFSAKTDEDRELYREMALLWLRLSKLNAVAAVGGMR